MDSEMASSSQLHSRKVCWADDFESTKNPPQEHGRPPDKRQHSKHFSHSRWEFSKGVNFLPKPNPNGKGILETPKQDSFHGGNFLPKFNPNGKGILVIANLDSFQNASNPTQRLHNIPPRTSMPPGWNAPIHNNQNGPNYPRTHLHQEHFRTSPFSRSSPNCLSIRQSNHIPRIPHYQRKNEWHLNQWRNKSSFQSQGRKPSLSKKINSSTNNERNRFTSLDNNNGDSGLLGFGATTGKEREWRPVPRIPLFLDNQYDDCE